MLLLLACTDMKFRTNPETDDTDPTVDSVDSGSSETGDDSVSESGDSPVDTSPPDLDGDGWPTAEDCNDGDASVHPDADETCEDGVDQDCDGADVACTLPSGDITLADATYVGPRAGNTVGHEVLIAGDLGGDDMRDLAGTAAARCSSAATVRRSGAAAWPGPRGCSGATEGSIPEELRGRPELHAKRLREAAVGAEVSDHDGPGQVQVVAPRELHTEARHRLPTETTRRERRVWTERDVGDRQAQQGHGVREAPEHRLLGHLPRRDAGLVGDEEQGVPVIDPALEHLPSAGEQLNVGGVDGVGLAGERAANGAVDVEEQGGAGPRRGMPDERNDLDRAEALVERRVGDDRRVAVEPVQ